MRPREFAATIASRHGVGAGRVRRPGAVLLRGRVPALSRQVVSVRHLHKHLATRIVLHVRQTRAEIRNTTVVRQAVVPDRVLPGPTLSRTKRRLGRAAPTEPGAPPVAVPRAPAARPVPVVLRRTAPPETPSRSSATAATRRPEPGEAPVPATRSQPPALPAVELDRVTDHVLRSLDRRLSSWRDRRGTH